MPFKENEPRPQQLPLFSDQKIILSLATYAVLTCVAGAWK